MSTLKSAPFRLFAYICALALSFLLLGAIGFYLVRSLRQDYASLIENHMPVLNQIRVVSKVTQTNRRMIGRLRPTSSEEARSLARKAFEESVLQNEHNLEVLAGMLPDKRSQAPLARLKAERDIYLKVAREVLGVPGKTWTEEEASDAKRRFYGAIENYVNEQEDFATSVTDLMLQDNAAIRERTNHTLVFFTAFALWPVLVGVGFFLYGLVSAAVHYNRTS